MKTRLFLLIAAALIFTFQVDAQIKLHQSGGISIGSDADPGEDIISLDQEVKFSTVTSDVNPKTSGTFSLGESNYKWDKLYVNELFTDDVSSHLIPSAASYNLGSSLMKWNELYVKDLSTDDVNSHLIPTTSNTYSLGTSSLKWKHLYAINTYTSYLTVGTGSIYDYNVKSHLIPYTDNTYSLGMNEVSQGGPHRWKDVYTYNLFTDYIEMKGLDLIVNDGSYGTTYVKFDFDLGEYTIDCGPSSNIYFSTDRSYYQFDEEIYIKGLWFNSDITLKKDIVRIKDSGFSLEKLKNLDGLTYKFKEDKDNIPYAGFSAQEMREILPDLVFEDEEGMLSVNYTGLIPYLLEAIKEQDERIIQLENALTESLLTDGK